MPGKANGITKIIALILTALAMCGAGAAAYASLRSTDAAHGARLSGVEKYQDEMRKDIKEILRRLPQR